MEKNSPKIPSHVAIIMDGNGRWANDRGLPKIAGHVAGADVVDLITEAASDMGVKVLTLYAFSTENWKRPKVETDALFELLGKRLDMKEAKLISNNTRFYAIGRIDDIPASARNKIRRVIAATKDNTGLVLNLALNYGSRLEIVEAARKMATDAKKGILDIKDIDEGLFSDYLYTRGLPDPDLLIRTSGEFRISNFLLWQISYSEIYVTNKLWPDFTRHDFEEAVGEYQKRERRYGG